MRLSLTVLVLVILTPVYAQGATTTSGAMSMVNVSDPPASSNTTNHLVTSSYNGGYAQAQTSGYAGGSMSGWGGRSR